jgi:uncharacterized protein YndB with AHSA1/START domain
MQMTRQRTFKRRVRERMAKTGESYTAARRMLIARGDAPDTPVPQFEPPVAEDRVVAATGRGWQQWLEVLDGWGAASRSHTEIARWLRDEHGVDGWYSQSITVGYERARGLRAPGQRPDGFAVGASKTVAVPVERLFEAFEDETLRERWLPGADLHLRTATAPRTARYDWEDGSTRVVVGFDDMGEAKSRVAVSHERLPDADAAEGMKAWWRERLVELKSLLEGGEIDAA